MSLPACTLWQDPPWDLKKRLDACLDRARDGTKAGSPPRIFFRADDVAVPGPRLGGLLERFRKFRTPLALAVIPAWLTPSRWQDLFALGGHDNGLWCWHQHGWRHVNHALSGKKQEFGPDRTPDEIERDLMEGRLRLESILDQAFDPIFTPPWNRCGESTLALLRAHGYRAVSRSRGSGPGAGALPDLAVNLDLHTRRVRVAEDGWDILLDELESTLAEEWCGVMIHHPRMNRVALEFMDLLLPALARSGFQALSFPDLASELIRISEPEEIKGAA